MQMRTVVVEFPAHNRSMPIPATICKKKMKRQHECLWAIAIRGAMQITILFPILGGKEITSTNHLFIYVSSWSWDVSSSIYKQLNNKFVLFCFCNREYNSSWQAPTNGWWEGKRISEIYRLSSINLIYVYWWRVLILFVFFVKTPIYSYSGLQLLRNRPSHTGCSKAKKSNCENAMP